MRSPPPALVALGVVVVGVTPAVVAMTMAARKIPVQIPRKVVGQRGRIREGQKSFIPLRVNSAGVMPIIFAQSFIVVPGTLAGVHGLRSAADAGAEIFAPQTMTYDVTYGLLILFFTYFYTAIIFNPIDLAENLKKQGAFVPGVKPGARTAEYIDRVLTRVTLPGSIYLAIIALIPVLDLRHLQHPDVLLRRHQPPDRRRRGPGHRTAGPAAPAAAALRRLHEEGPRQDARPPAVHVAWACSDGRHPSRAAWGRKGDAGRAARRRARTRRTSRRGTCCGRRDARGPSSGRRPRRSWMPGELRAGRPDPRHGARAPRDDRRRHPGLLRRLPADDRPGRRPRRGARLARAQARRGGPLRGARTRRS